MGNSVDLDEVAHKELPHQDLRCLQIQLFLSLVLKELNWTFIRKYRRSCVQVVGAGTHAPLNM